MEDSLAACVEAVDLQDPESVGQEEQPHHGGQGSAQNADVLDGNPAYDKERHDDAGYEDGRRVGSQEDKADRDDHGKIEIKAFLPEGGRQE